MIKLNLSNPLTDLDGNKADGYNNLAKSLANTLAVMPDTTDPIKYYDFALNLNKNSYLEVDNSDYDKLYNLIKNHKQMVVFLKAQLLKKFKQAKESSEKEAKESSKKSGASE